MTDYKKLVEALQTIKDECNSHINCYTCPMGNTKVTNSCEVVRRTPNNWDIEAPKDIIRLIQNEDESDDRRD